MRTPRLSYLLEKRAHLAPNKSLRQLALLSVSDASRVVEDRFYKTPLGLWVDEKVHERNVRELRQKWRERGGGLDWKQELIATYITTIAGKHEMALAMVGSVRKAS